MRKRVFKTELEALIACRNHWQFLEITRGWDKTEYKPSKKWDIECAMCQWDNMFNGDCTHCLLSNYAWKEYCTIGNNNSFWKMWANADTPEQRKFYANRMVYACNQAIEY